MKKRKDFAFGKDVYRLGKNIDGDVIWLEAPSWDCKWYWGFGYVETYTKENSPSKSRDINSHTHWDSIHKENENAIVDRTFSDDEYKELKELFNEFYRLKEIANKVYKTDEKLWKKTNQVDIPKITGRIIEILTP